VPKYVLCPGAVIGQLCPVRAWTRGESWPVMLTRPAMTKLVGESSVRQNVLRGMAGRLLDASGKKERHHAPSFSPI